MALMSYIQASKEVRGKINVLSVLSLAVIFVPRPLLNILRASRKK